MFPQFDPVLVQLGPFGIRWYALAYIAGLVLGWRLLRRLVAVAAAGRRRQLQVDDFLTWATLGVVLGGRLGYVLFYQPGVYLAHPLQILEVWHGGMSFHGGALGVALAILSVLPPREASRSWASPTASRSACRSGWASAASPTSSTASCGAARRRTGCPGR